MNPNQSSLKTARINIYGIIGYDWWTDTDNTGERFVNDLQNVIDEGAEEVHVHINSVGGDVHEGQSIVSAIRNSSVKITTIVDGVAYSMASIIAASGNEVKMAPNALFMVHSASTFEWGNSKDFIKTADVLSKYDKSLGVILAEKIGKETDEIIKDYFNGEDHFFTAEESLEAGFIDSILPKNEIKVPDNLKDMQPMQVAAFFHNQDKSFFSKMKNSLSGIIGESGSGTKPKNKSKNQENMKIQASQVALIAALGLTFGDNETEREVEVTDDLLAKINDQLVAGTQATTKVDDLTNSLSTAEKDRDSWKAKYEEIANESDPPGGKPGGEDPDKKRTAKHSWEINAEKRFNN